MPRCHQSRPTRRVGLAWLAGARSLGLVGAAAGVLATAGPAGAAPTPTYHAGSDTATFTASGVLEGNCLIATDGTDVWIKTGDVINFKSAVAGIDLAGMNLTSGQVAGLNVTAAIDATTTSPGQSVPVSAGHTTVFPKAGQHALTAGEHKLAWTVKSLTLVGGLLGSLLTVPLSSSDLKSGASLSWSGVIHVTKDAPQCKLSVGTPTVGISVGPIKVTVPPISVGVALPTVPTLPKLPTPPGASGSTTPPPGGKTTPPGVKFTPPPLTVPEQVMGGGGGGGGGGGFGGVQADGSNATQLGNGLPGVPVAGSGPGSTKSPAAKPKTTTKHIDLAANRAPAAQMPVLLAIIAIIALSVVTATYARLYLLRRNT